MALAYVVGLRDYDLRAIIVEGTGVVHCPAGGDVAAQLVAELGSTIPVACGSGTPVGAGHANPEEWRTAADSAFGVRLADATADAAGDAVELLTGTISLSSAPVDILAIGPMTTIAQALDATPGLAKRIHRIVVMAGAFDVPGNVMEDQQPGSPEWNVWADPVAAQRVFSAHVPIVEVPLDATNHVPITTSFYAELAADHVAGPADVVFELLARNPYLVGGGSYFWDPLAAVSLEEPSVLALNELRVRIGTGAQTEVGRTMRDEAAPAIQVALTADTAVFTQHFLAGLRRGPARGTPFTIAGTVALTFDGQRCTLGNPPARPGLYTVEFSWAGVASAIAVLVTLHPGHAWQEAIDFAADLQHQAVSPAWADLAPVPQQIAGVRPIVAVPAGTSGFACAIVDRANQATGVVLAAPFTVGTRP